MNTGIRDLAIYYPENTVDNNYYLEHFKKMGKDETEFYKMIGQDKRKIIDNDEETTISLGIKAAQKVMEQQNLSGTDFDLIIFSSQFPEYMVPSQALTLHQAIGGKKECLTFDINVNCVGMLVAFDLANGLLKDNVNMKRALVIGADYISKHCRNDSTLYSYFGDLGCALVLERSDRELSVLDRTYICESSEYDILKFPYCGMSKIYRESIQKNDKKATLTRGERIDRAKLSYDDIERLLARNNLKPNDVDYYCVSQAALPNLVDMRKHFGISEEKMPYVGCNYGYTGTSSPFLVLHDLYKNNKVNRGDLVLLWSIGASYQTYGILLKF